MGELLRENSYLVAAIADLFRQARGAGPWSTANLPGQDAEWAYKALALADENRRTPSAALPSEPTACACAKCGPIPDVDEAGCCPKCGCASTMMTGRTPASTGKAGEGERG